MEKRSKKEYKDILKEDESNQKLKATNHEQRSDATEVGDGLKDKHKKDKAKGAKREKQKVGVENKSGKLSGVEDEEHDGKTVGDSSRKRKRKNNENEITGSSGNNIGYDENGVGSNTKGGMNIDEKGERVHDVEPGKGKSLETSSEVRDKKDKRKKDKKREAAERNGGESDLSFLKPENVNGDNQLAKCDKNGLEKQDGKKKKKKKKKNKNSTKRGMNIDEKEDRAHDDKHEKGKSLETSSNVHCKKVNRKKDKKRKATEINGREDDLSFLKQENAGNENDVEKQDRKKKKKKRKEKQANDDNNSNPSSVQDTAVSASNALGDNDPDEVHNSEGVEVNKRKKKKSKASENVDLTPKKSNKKVQFSDQVEVFPLTSEADDDKVENLVIGKRFTPEEDEIVKKAVYDYIEENNLGEEGLEMVLNSRKYSKVRGCWKEIAARAIPYRPYSAVYYRGQILFRRSESRTWTQEEYDMVLAYQQRHGNQWKALADELGKHHWHVKDTYRRIKLQNRQKGHWSQEEYQNLFDLVNADLQLKISEEKKSKHGMLRDNISWSAISERMETRATPHCCMKWYRELTSPMVIEGIWADADDYRLIGALYSLDENCMEDVDWDNLVEGRSGELCRKRWTQMRRHIGHHGKKTFAEQVEVLAERYCPHLLETREEWDSKPRVP